MAQIVLVPNLAGQPGARIALRPPLGLISLVTVLARDGFDAEIVDANVLLPDHSYEQICDALVARDPAVLGFSTMCDNYLTTIKLARLCKQMRPGLTVVLGGPQASITDRATLEAFPFVDVIARGECEQTISALMGALLAGRSPVDVPGITCREGGKIVRTPPLPPLAGLDAIPMPDYRLYPHLAALKKIHIEVGRGCPYRCTFCSTNDFWSRRYRLRSTERLVALLRELHAEHGFREFVFDHDNLTASRARVIALCRGIRAAGLDIRWRCSSRIDCLDTELIREMAGAGCNRVYLGIETGSPRMQKLIKKNLDLSHAVETVREILDAGIGVTASFILGFPQEQMDDLLCTIDLLLKLRFARPGLVNVFLFMLAPTPLTPLYESHREALRFDGNLSVIAYSELTDEDRALITQHPEIFAAYHYYETPHLARDMLLRTHFLIDHLLLLPNTLRILREEEQLGFPRRFLDRIGRLEVPSLARYHTAGQLAQVADFLTAVLTESGHVDHRLLSIMKREIAVNRVLGSELGRGFGFVPGQPG